MVEQKFNDQLTDVLKASSDPTRRSILTTLVQEGPTRVTDLAAYYDISLNAVSKHIKVLEAAGLVRRETHGRTHVISADMAPVALIDSWFSELRSIWELRLAELETALLEDANMKELSLTVSRQIKAPVEKVFNAWLDPQMMRRFMAGGPNMKVSLAENDPKVGGRFKVIMTDGDNEVPHSGEYKEITPHSRIVFTWESPFSIDGSTVTLDFADAGHGTTDVALSQVRFYDEGKRDGHAGGWTHILSRLDEAMA
jgi:uncharacterized protein YndB with AHSA1/START domain